MKESFHIRYLRNVRNLTFWTLEPIDFAARRLAGMPQYPPIPLRRHVGHLGGMDGPGFEFAAYLKLLAGLRTGHRVWDIGCGCGLLELALESAQWKGDLVGTDIHGPSIRWAQRRITPRCPSFRFEHADIHNAAYWPGGRLDAKTWLNEFPEREFNVIVAKSFFTHVLPEELNLYVRDAANRLTEGGRVLLTFFLLNETAEINMRAGKSAFQFQAPEEGAPYAVRRLSAPTAAVAYREAYLREILARTGLAIRGNIHYGYWSGREDGLSFQDLIVAEKKS